MKRITTNSGNIRNSILFFIVIGILIGCTTGIGIYFKKGRGVIPQDTKDQSQKTLNGKEDYQYNEEISYYPIYGSTKAELIHEMNQSGIQDEDGTKRFAYTGWYTHWDYTHKQTETSCSLSSVTVAMDVSILFPTWEDDPQDGSDLSKQWKVYSEKLLNHEYIHRDAAKACGKKILSALQTTSPQTTCSDLESAMRTKSSALLEECNKKDLDIDEVSNHGVNDGVVF